MFNVQNQRNYDLNPTPIKKVLHGHICGTHFLVDFLKPLRNSKILFRLMHGSISLGQGKIHFLSLGRLY